MPKGRGYGGWAVAAVLVLIFLVSTNTWNPFPDLWSWLNSSDPVSRPAPTWQQRIGGAPRSVTIAGGAMVVEQRGAVEGRRVSDGSQIWTRKADWSAVAGSGVGSAAVFGKLLVKGYDVVDPATGTTLRHDSQAVAVWTYREAILDVRCQNADECTLTAWPPRDNHPMWTVDIPGIGFVLFADNPELQTVRPLTASKVEDHAGGPDEMPRLLGFPLDGGVYIVDTSEGKVLPEIKPDRNEQVVVVGGRVLRITATSADGTCYFAVDARDGVTGRPVWHEAGINLRTVSGAGCVQRNKPSGAGSVILVVAPDTREALFDAYDGRALWIGKAGERVLAMDNRRALVRSADRKSIKGIGLGSGDRLWTRSVNANAQAALTPSAAVIVDSKPDRIIVLDPRTGAEKLNLRSTAKVLACGPDGVVLGYQRELGYLPFRSTAGASPRPGGETPPGSVRKGAVHPDKDG